MTRVIYWSLLFVVLFSVAYTLTDLAVKYVMADYVEPSNGYTTLEVVPNYGTQTDNHYKLQVTQNPQQQ